MAHCINRKDLDGEPWMEELLTALDDEKKTREEQIDKAVKNDNCPSEMHGTFLAALSGLPKGVGRADMVKMYQTRLRDISDSDPSNWISEMIQNARDVDATNIDISYTDSTLTLGHNGRKFKPAELSALLKISLSTKQGDVATIGKFGVGFKYWHTHFKRLKVVVWYDGTKHTLSINGQFWSEESTYCYIDDSTYKERTEFRFEEPQDDGDWGDFTQGSIGMALGERVKGSLPFMQTTDDPFTISLDANGKNTTYSCRIDEDLSTNNLTLHRIAYGQSNNLDKVLRMRMTLSKLESLENKVYTKFKSLVIKEYMDNDTVKEIAAEKSMSIDVVAEEKAEEAFERTHITLLLTSGKDKGSISNLFIATEAKMSTAYIADAPWMLTDTRLNISRDYSNNHFEWNQNIAVLVDRVYSEMMKAILNENQNFGLTSSEMYELLNCPLGSGDLELDRFFRNNPRYSLVNHLKTTFGLNDDDTYNCSKALIWLWKSLNSAGHTDERRWLEDAMYEKLATVKLTGDIKCPIRDEVMPNLYGELSSITIGNNQPLREICDNLGAGIPSVILKIVDGIRNNSANNDKPLLPELLGLFDDVIKDIDGNSRFFEEVKPDIIGEEIDPTSPDGQLIEGLVNYLEEALNTTELYFLNPQGNLDGHISRLPPPLKFEDMIEKLVKKGYEKSADPNLQNTLNPFLEFLKDNIPNELNWGRVILAKKMDEDTSPILILLPPEGYLLAVAIGTDCNYLLSLKKSALKNHTVKLDNTRPPEVLIWGEGTKRDIVYIRTEEIPEVQRSRNDITGNWDRSDFNFDNTGGFSDGWKWPLVTFDHLDSQKDKIDAKNRSTPIFIDGFYPKSDGDYGIHLGLRIKDSKDNIKTEYNSIYPYKVRKKREVDCQGDSMDMKIMSAAVDLDGDEVNNYKTGGGKTRTLPEFDGDTPRIHGVVRIIGVLSKLVENESLYNETNDEERLRKLHKFSWWNKCSQESDLDKDIMKTKDAFDVMWVEGGDRQRIGLCARYIPVKNLKSANNIFIDDDDEPRQRGYPSPTFEDLANNGIVGFQENKYEQPFDVLYQRDLFPQSHLWLPRLSMEEPGSAPLGYFSKWKDIDPLRLHSVNEIEIILRRTQKIDPTNVLRPGLNRLLEEIFNSPPKQQTESEGLDWLNELFVYGLPTGGWLDSKVNSSQNHANRRMLLDILENYDPQEYKKIREEIQRVNSQMTWNEFKQAAYTNADKNQLLNDFSNVNVPILREDDGFWSTNERDGKTIIDLSKEDLGIIHVLVSRKEKFSQALFHIRNNFDIYIVPDDRVLDALKLVCNGNKDVDLKEVKLHRTLEVKIKKNKKEYPHLKIKYIDDMMKELRYQGNPIEVRWYSFDNREDLVYPDHPLYPETHCIAIEWEENKNNTIIHLSNPNNDAIPKLSEHKFMASCLLEFFKSKGMDKELENVVEAKQIISPWWFTIPIRGTTENNVVDFNRRYCAEELRLEELKQKLEGAQNNDELEDILDTLVDLYRDEAENLRDSIAWLPDLYEKVPSIIPDWNSWNTFTPQNAVSVRLYISIPHNMINSIGGIGYKNGENLSSIGSYLIVNPAEMDSFRGYSSNFDPEVKIAHDFSSDLSTLLYEAIVDQWFSGQDNFIRIDKMFLSNEGTLIDGKLHKFHAIHILAYLWSIGLM